MEVWIATTNQGKLREIEKGLTPRGVTIKSLKDMAAYYPPDETGKTFVENARLKAKSLASIKNSEWVIGEDSGLEVEALGGLPGVHSARYAGNHAKDMENCLKLIKILHLKAATNRNARLVCTMVALSPKGEEFVFEGELKGSISPKMRGTEGFGYDPVFIPEGETKTLAELGLAAKNKLSHRAIATTKLLEVLK